MTSIFVDDLGANTTDAHLFALFSEYGKIEEADNRSWKLGYAFVKFKTPPHLLTSAHPPLLRTLAFVQFKTREGYGKYLIVILLNCFL